MLIPVDKSAPLSKDIEDRRGKKPTLMDKAQAKASWLTQAVKDDYDDAKADKSNSQSVEDKIKNIGGNIPSYKKGGKVRRTGLAFVHKGEHVVPKSKVKNMARKRG